MLKMYKTLTAFLNLLINQIFYYFFKKNFSTYSKMYKNSSAKFYQNNKGRLQKKARERYQSLSKEEEKKRQYGREGYKDKKQYLLEYRKKYYKMYCVLHFASV